MVAHTLHRHSESLVNELEVIKNPYSPLGPMLVSHRGEASLQSRLPVSYSLTALVPQGSPIYVVYKIGGDPGEGQFLNEPPKEIPHGYTCVYIPDSISPTRAGHLVGTGASGADAEKQAWLAKYATGPSAKPSAQVVLSVE